MNILEIYSGNQVSVNGTNSALATSNEFVSLQSIVWGEGSTNRNASFGAGAALTVASTSANDKGTATAGTGARTIVVIGVQGTTGKIIEETITLNGQTSVASVNLFQLVLGAYCASFGTGLANAGIIGIAIGTCTNTSGALTAPTPALTIPIGMNDETVPLFMVPPGAKYVISKIAYGVSTQHVVVTILIRDAATGAWYTRAIVPLGNTGSGEAVEHIKGTVLDEGDVIRVDALSTTAAGRVFVNLILDRIV